MCINGAPPSGVVIVFITSTECMIVNMNRFKVGNIFNSFKELEEEIKAFEQESFVNLVKRHCRSIENVLKGIK